MDRLAAKEASSNVTDNGDVLPTSSPETVSNRQKRNTEPESYFVCRSGGKKKKVHGELLEAVRNYLGDAE